MKGISSIRVKALLLLVIFSLNMTVGFACPLGIHLCFNCSHHGQEAATPGHEHGEHCGRLKGMGCCNKAAHKGGCCNKAAHKGGCCDDRAILLQQTDKSVVNTITLNDPLWATIVSPFFNLAGIFTLSNPLSLESKLCRYYPPPDIRVLIHSFQI